MGLWQRIFGSDEKRASIENPSVPIGSSAAALLLGGWMGDSTAGVAVNHQTAMTCAPVWAAVNFISSSIADLPLHVYQRDGENRTRLDDDVSATLARWPNPVTTSFTWRKRMMQDVLLCGRHVSFIERNRAGRLMNLWPLDITKVKVSLNVGEWLYSYTDGTGLERKYSPADVVDITWSLESDGVTHRDPIVLLRDAIGLYLAMERYASKAFQNGGVPPMQLKGPTTNVNSAQAASDDLTRALAEATKKQRNILVMPMGFELSPIGFEPEKMQMEEARLYQLGEIARVFGLPRVFLQDLTGGTYSNTEQQDLHFVKHTLAAWLKNIEQELNLKLFGPRGSGRKDTRFAEFNVDGLLRGDFKSRMEGYATAVQNGIKTPNEIRRKENDPPMPNGDDLLIQGATVPLGTQPVEPTAPAPGAPADGGDDET